MPIFDCTEQTSAAESWAGCLHLSSCQTRHDYDFTTNARFALCFTSRRKLSERMQAAPFRIANDNQNRVQFQSFTAASYEKIKQRERRKERNCKDTSRDARPGNASGDASGDSSGDTSGREMTTHGSDAAFDCEFGGTLNWGCNVDEQGQWTLPSPSSGGNRDSESTDSWETLSGLLSIQSDRTGGLDPFLSTMTTINTAPSSCSSSQSMLPLLADTPLLGRPIDFEQALFPDVSGIGEADESATSLAFCATGGCDLSHTDDAPPMMLTCPGSTIDSLSTEDLNDSGSDESQTIDPLMDCSGASNAEVETQPLEPAYTPLLSPNPEAVDKWSAEDDSRLYHLQITAGLPWDRVARYFPHTALPALRDRWAANSAVTLRGRPRKQRRRSAKKKVGRLRHGSTVRPSIDPSQSSAALGHSRYVTLE